MNRRPEGELGMHEHTQSAGRRRAARIALLTISAVLASTATASAAQWQRYNVDGDAFYDIAAIDRGGNGNFEDIYFDIDNDGAWDANLYNTRRSDAFLEVLDFDMDENDEVEIRLSDQDQREGFDYIQVDLDQNGYWDRWRGYTRRIIPNSNLDAVRRSNRQNASSRLIYDYRQRTGMSLLYPNLPGAY
jgi:hypothetical protein